MAYADLNWYMSIETGVCLFKSAYFDFVDKLLLFVDLTGVRRFLVIDTNGPT